MPKIHEPEYYELAKYYDMISQKYVPYKKHFKFIEGALEKYGKKVKRILDLACGTGTHSVYLARKGYDVVGIDISREMLNIAREKARAAGVRAEFLEGDIRDMHFNNEFDAAICINQSVMYCITRSDIRNFIVGARDSLKRGGILIVDFLSIYDKVASAGKEWVDSEGVRIECIREETYNRVSQILTDKLTYFVTEGEMIQRFEGYEQSRVFYPQEFLFYLESIGNFRILGMHECWSLEEEPIGPYLAVVAESA